MFSLRISFIRRILFLSPIPSGLAITRKGCRSFQLKCRSFRPVFISSRNQKPCCERYQRHGCPEAICMIYFEKLQQVSKQLPIYKICSRPLVSSLFQLRLQLVYFRSSSPSWCQYSRLEPQKKVQRLGILYYCDQQVLKVLQNSLVC